LNCNCYMLSAYNNQCAVAEQLLNYLNNAAGFGATGVHTIS
jgi:hypothetical protein